MMLVNFYISLLGVRAHFSIFVSSYIFRIQKLHKEISLAYVRSVLCLKCVISSVSSSHMCVKFTSLKCLVGRIPSVKAMISYLPLDTLGQLAQVCPPRTHRSPEFPQWCGM